MDNCCDSLFKTLLLIFNLAFAVVGLVLIGFGAYAQLAAKNLLNFLSDDYLNTPVFIIILGAVIFVIAFFGCCGAIRESKCMMYTYGLLLCVILIAQIGAGIAAFAVKGDLNNVIKDNMNKGLTNYGKEGFNGVTETWDAVQNEFNCCGVTDWNDWKNQTQFQASKSVPDSCCKEGQVEGCGTNTQDPTKFNTNGCFSTFSDLFVGNLVYVGVTALCVAAAEILVISLACCLGKKMGLNAQYV
jgi:ABC-type transport system involved in multi-copper enzyme maturation permease subunit